MQSNFRILFAGGGTGGHLFPALAVAESLRKLMPDAAILFVGNKNKIEGRVVPKLGFNFKSIWIKGFARRLSFANLLFPVRLTVSLFQSLIINMKFKPNVAIGSGGYVAGPAIWGAKVMGAKILLLEQNSYPGVTTRILAKYANEIHVSYVDSKKYFNEKEKVFISGCPTRRNEVLTDNKSNTFGFHESKKTILVLGGSGGAKSINEAVAEFVSELKDQGISVIWQTGNFYFENYRNLKCETVYITPFIDNMSEAYSVCDLVVARAGATTIAELSNLGKPCILIPSPNVAENHQYYNAKSIADEGGCILIADENIKSELRDKLLSLIWSEEKLKELSQNINKFSNPDAADLIARRIIRLAETVL